jgi:phosphate transport system substrate-binding protein
VNRNVLSRRGVAGVALAAIAAIALAGCGTDTPETTPSGDADGIASITADLKASGASFPDAYYQDIISELQTVAPDFKLTYNPVGSGTGKKEFGSGLTDFAGSDSTVKDTDGVPMDSFYYIPTVAAPITISYNLPGVNELKLSPATVAKIFQRDIKVWNDAAIQADNTGVTLPGTAITVAHRSDGSGTTSNFTKFLVAAAKDTWKLGSGDTVNWPADTLGGAKNAGVAGLVKQTPGTIGYVDLADADGSQLQMAAIKNKDGNFVKPSLEGATAALAGATVKEDLTFDPLNAAGAQTYPITAPTYLLVKKKYDDPAKATAVKEYVKYLLGDGAALAKDTYFAVLPADLKAKALAQLDKVS